MRTDRMFPIVMQLTRLFNSWKAYERRGHELVGERFTTGELQVLKAVAEFPAYNTTELALELGVTKGAVSQTITKLVGRGFMERYRAPDNERDTFTRPTIRGSKVYQAHRKMLEEKFQAFDELLGDTGPEHVEFLLDFLAKVEGSLREQLDSEAG